MADIRFWYASGACSLAPHILLHEIGLPFDPVETSIAKGANLTEDFMRINPKGRVPVLSLDGEIITEVPAIASAIAALAPDRHLMGRTEIDRARVLEWMNWLSGTLHTQGFGALWRPQRFTDDPGAFAAIEAKARRSIGGCFEVIDGRLAGDFSAGDAFSAADPYLLVFYRWGNGIGIDMRTRYPRFTTFAQRLVQRPSVMATLLAERLADRPLDDRVPSADPVVDHSTATKENGI